MELVCIRALAVVAGLVTAGGCAVGAPSSGPDERTDRPYVVLVSFDAFRHDYIERYAPPAFLELASRGVRASALIPAFPSKTFPNHYSIVTGLHPGQHGIVGNAFYDPDRRAWFRLSDTSAVRDGSWYSGEPIWATAARRGVKSGAWFWPGSEAWIGGVRPAYFRNYDGTVPNATRVNGVMTWLRKPASERPHLVLLYFSDVDDTTHAYGPDAPQTAVAVAAVDRLLRHLLDSVGHLPFADSVNIVLVSDHGMMAIPPRQVIPVTDLLAKGGVDTTRLEVSDNGPTLSLWFGGDSLRVQQAYAVLDRDLQRAKVYRRSEIPGRWRLRENRRAGDLLLVADPGFILQRRGGDRAPSRGAHGYDSSVPEMRGIFVAAGPNVRQLGVLPAFENVHIYPFLAALLRLDDVPRTDGDPRVLGRAVR